MAKMDQQLQKSKLAAVHNTTQLDSRFACALERQLQKRENFWISLFMCQLLTNWQFKCQSHKKGKRIN